MREGFWKPPRRESSAWSSEARFPSAPVGASSPVPSPWSACAGCKPGEGGEGLRRRWRRKSGMCGRELEVVAHLAGFETQFDLHLAGLRADPHVHLRDNKETSTMLSRMKWWSQSARSLPLCRCPAAWCRHQPGRPDRSPSISLTQRNNPSRWNTWGSVSGRHKRWED